MSFATVRSCTLSGVSAVEVTVEVHITGGLPGIAIVGLPQSAVRESKDRVKAAIVHAGLIYPQVKIIVNLAPLIYLSKVADTICLLPLAYSSPPNNCLPLAQMKW